MVKEPADIKKAVSKITEGYELISVKTREDYEAVTRQIQAASAIEKQVHEFFDEDIKKANDLHKSLTKKRRAFLEPLEEFIGHCKRVGAEFLVAEQQKAAAEANKLKEQAEKAGIDTTLVPVDVPKVDPGEGLAITETWSYEVVDEKLIPREYMAPDHAKIKAHVVAFKDKSNIPGIKATKQASMRRTGK